MHHSVAAALALDRADEAVRLYVRAELYADALLLARLRLPSRRILRLSTNRIPSPTYPYYQGVQEVSSCEKDLS